MGMTGSLFRCLRGRTARNLAWLLAWGALWLTACGPNPAPSATDAAFAAVRRALDEGLYGQAQRQAATLESRLKSTSNSLTYARALDLLVEALARDGKAAGPTHSHLANGQSLSRSSFTPASWKLARSLDLVGLVHNERGEFDLAVDPSRDGLENAQGGARAGTRIDRRRPGSSRRCPDSPGQVRGSEGRA